MQEWPGTAPPLPSPPSTQGVSFLFFFILFIFFWVPLIYFPFPLCLCPPFLAGPPKPRPLPSPSKPPSAPPLCHTRLRAIFNFDSILCPLKCAEATAVNEKKGLGQRPSRCIRKWKNKKYPSLDSFPTSAMPILISSPPYTKIFPKLMKHTRPYTDGCIHTGKQI